MYGRGAMLPFSSSEPVNTLHRFPAADVKSTCKHRGRYWRDRSAAITRPQSHACTTALIYFKSAAGILHCKLRHWKKQQPLLSFSPLFMSRCTAVH
eukprot:1146047-Pelagomonas_calceolata.AAC.8